MNHLVLWNWCSSSVIMNGVCGRMALNLLLKGWPPMVIHSVDINLKTENDHFNLMNAQIGPKVFHRPRDTGPWSLN